MGLHDLPDFKPGAETISAGALNAMLRALKRLDAEHGRQNRETTQLLIKTQAAINSGATGSVKRAYWDGAAYQESGPAFTALNVGPSNIPISTYAFLSGGAGQYPFFQYTAVGGGGGSEITAVTTVAIEDTTQCSDETELLDANIAVSSGTYLIGVTLLFRNEYEFSLDTAQFTLKDDNGDVCLEAHNDRIGSADHPLEGLCTLSAVLRTVSFAASDELHLYALAATGEVVGEDGTGYVGSYMTVVGPITV